MKSLSTRFFTFSLCALFVFGFSSAASAQKKNPVKVAKPVTPVSKVAAAPVTNNQTPVAETPIAVTNSQATATAFALPKFEAEVLAEINLLRSNPSAYAVHLEDWKKNFDGNLLKIPGRTPIETIEGTAVVDEAIDFLKKSSKMADVAAVRGLTNAANDHLKDLITKNFRGHRGSNGSLPDQRIAIHGEMGGEIRELITYFAPTARQIVINLLIDDGNKNRPHRDALLKNTLHQIGIMSGDSTSYGKLCVVVMAENFTEKP